MKNHDILFDKKNSKIGFVKSNCGALKDDSKSLYKLYTASNFIQSTAETQNKSTEFDNSSNSTVDI